MTLHSHKGKVVAPPGSSTRAEVPNATMDKDGGTKLSLQGLKAALPLLNRRDGHHHQEDEEEESSVVRTLEGGTGTTGNVPKPDGTTRWENNDCLEYCNFNEFQELFWKSQDMTLNEFDEHGVPYSPNLYGMWMRHCRRFESQNPMGAESAVNKKVSEEERENDNDGGPHYKYCPDSGYVVFCDGLGGTVPVVSGTWIVDSEDQIVAVNPFAPYDNDDNDIINSTNNNDVTIEDNPHLVYQSHRDHEGRIMRNRCYSGNVEEARNEDEDSGIQLDLLDQGLEYEEGSPPFYYSTPIMNTTTATNDDDL